MKKAASFYKKYGHIRKILIVVTLEQVLGEHLAYPEDPDKRRIELRKCKLPEVYADAGCPAEDLVDREHLISTVDKEIVFPLIQAFDGPIKQKKNDRAHCRASILVNRAIVFVHRFRMGSVTVI